MCIDKTTSVFVNGVEKTTFKDPAWLVYARECGDVCPINLTKPLKTKNGYRVVNPVFVPKNSSGDGSYVTFPIKGTIILRENPLKTSYQVWQLNGSAGLPFTSLDLDV